MSRKRRYMKAACGFALMMAMLLLAAEAYLRWRPPRDLHPFMGDDAPMRDHYRPHPRFVYTYRDGAAFESAYQKVLADFGPPEDPADGRPTWAYFGNSFMQMPGALADTVAAAVPDRRHFYLKLNPPLMLQMAQLEMLLARGLRPQRVFFEFMPVDSKVMGKLPLRTYRVNRHGALTHTVASPGGPMTTLLSHSRLALCAWVRSGRHAAYPWFKGRHMYTGPPRELLDDWKRLFGELAVLAREYDVPVTVILFPDRYQVVRNRSYLFQDWAAPMLAELGFDVLDPRAAFMAQTDKPTLFMPDGHYSARGNAVMLGALMRHLNELDAYPWAEPAP